MKFFFACVSDDSKEKNVLKKIISKQIFDIFFLANFVFIFLESSEMHFEQVARKIGSKLYFSSEIFEPKKIDGGGIPHDIN